MKLSFFTSLLLCVCVFTLRASFATEPEASRIFGVAKFVVGASSIQITKDDSLPYELDLIPGNGGSESKVKSLSVNVGDSFTISDQHHVSMAYRLIKISGDAALMEEIRWTHFPDKGEHKSNHSVLIRTYGDR